MNRLNQLKKQVQFWINDIYKLGFYHILTVNTLTNILSFASQLFVVWILTAEDIGQIRIMQSFLTYAVLAGGLGFNSSTLKLCSEDRLAGEKIFLYKKSIKYAGLLALISLIVFIILNHFGLLIQNKHFRNPLNLFLLSIVPMTINGIDIAYLQSIREFIRLSKIQLISRVTSIVLIITLTYFKGLYGFIIANVIGTGFSAILLFNAVDKVNKVIIPIQIKDPFKLHMRYSGLAFLSNVTYQASVYFDIILLNYLVKDDLKGIGSYGFATIVINVLTLITFSFQQVLIPIFSNVSKNFGNWIKVYKKYRKIYLLGVALVGVLAITFLPFILNTVFGSKYPNISRFTIILTIAWILKSYYSFQSSALFGKGDLKTILRLSLILVVIGLPLNFLMIDKFSVIGAGFASLTISLIGLIIYHTAFNSIVNKQMQIFEQSNPEDATF